MRHISTKEAADKLHASAHSVQTFSADGRVTDAKRYGNYMMVSDKASKPCNQRMQYLSRATDFYTMAYKCPQLIFTNLYCVPGKADELCKSLEYDTLAQALFASQLAYFRGSIDEAKAIAQHNLDSANNRPDVQMGFCFVLALCAMYNGDIDGWLCARKKISNVSCSTLEEEAQRDFQLGGIDSGLYDDNGFPEWFKAGEFDPLPADCYPLARMLFLKWMLISRGNPSISEICGPIISQSRMEGALLSEIYCLILTSIGFHDRGNIAAATKLIDKAIEKALPDKIFSPFAEYRSEFGVLLDDRLEFADKNAYDEVRKLNKRLISGWAELCRVVRNVNFTENLSQRERHAAKLAAKGLTNTEIAERMNVSVNTVKRYISEVMAKTGAKNRKAIAEYIALSGETLP